MTPPRPVYTTHALKRMRQRGIRRAEVEATLVAPLGVRFDPNGNPILLGRVGRRFIEVVVARGSWPPVIITLWPR